MSDREPKPAPFKTGTRVRYIGNDRVYADSAGKIPLLAPGMEFVIIEVKPGRRGTLRQLRDEDGPITDDETGEPILDMTRDGRSIYMDEIRGRGRIIWPDRAGEWEVIR